MRLPACLTPTWCAPARWRRAKRWWWRDEGSGLGQAGTQLVAELENQITRMQSGKPWSRCGVIDEPKRKNA